jgi:integrase
VPETKGLTLATLFDLYDGQTQARSKEETTRATEGYHRAHLLRLLGDKLAVEAVELRHLQRYANARRAEEWRGKPIGPATILKEAATLRVIWNWGPKMGHHARSFPLQLQDLEFDRREDRPPFQTYGQITATIARGVPPEEQTELWECFYLTLDEVHALLDHVNKHAYHPFIHPMFVLTAMTGARRSEICRARVEDFDFDRRLVHPG